MPKEIILNAEKSFIGAWLLDDVSICDRLIDHFEKSEKKFEGTINTSMGNVIWKEVKDSTDLVLDSRDEITLEYANLLQEVTNEYVKIYEWSNKTGPWVVQSAQIQKYEPGGGYNDWHTERCSAAQSMVGRHLVFMTYLNDVTDQGETEWLYQKLKVKPQKGLTIIWPSDWTHTHRGIISPTQAKYIVTGWYMFVEE